MVSRNNQRGISVDGPRCSIGLDQGTGPEKKYGEFESWVEIIKDLVQSQTMKYPEKPVRPHGIRPIKPYN
jgi:hypothetical protein